MVLYGYKALVAVLSARSSPAFDYPKQNLASFLVTSAQKFPNRPAMYFMGKTINYRSLLESSYRMANALRDKGIKKGDRVAIIFAQLPAGGDLVLWRRWPEPLPS